MVQITGQKLGQVLCQKEYLDDSHYAYLWRRQLHIFRFPLYYTGYAIAPLGAVVDIFRGSRVEI